MERLGARQECEWQLDSFLRLVRDGDIVTAQRMYEDEAVTIRSWLSLCNAVGKSIWTTAAKYGHLDFLRWFWSLWRQSTAASDTASLHALLVRAVPRTGMTPLHYAARYGHGHVVEWLLDQGCPVELGSVQDWRCIHFAVSEGHLELCRLLEARGASLVACTSLGVTPLALACANKMHAIVHWLLQQDVVCRHVNLADQLGLTPLHKAARTGDLDVVTALVQIGKADLSLLDISGNTAFDEADRCNMTDVAVFLWNSSPQSRRGLVHPSTPTRHAGPLKWFRPRVLSSPEARFHVATCSRGSSVYSFGGVGLPKGMINHDPENRLPEELKTICHNDIHKLDFDDWSMEYILPPHDAAWAHQRTYTLENTGKPHFIHLRDPYYVEVDTAASADLGPCIVRASHPFRKEVGFGYFEVHIVDIGCNATLAIGLTDEEYPTEQTLPGWAPDSYALHGDDGAVFHNSGNGKPFCCPFNADDIIGCGINWATGEIFFTRNGRFLGVAFRGPRAERYWASIGVDSTGAKLRVNFGVSPFHFGYQLPTRRWRLLPQDGHTPPPMLFSHLVPIRNDQNLILIPDYRYSTKGVIWLYNTQTCRWLRRDSSGDFPAVHASSQIATIGMHIWLFTPCHNGADTSPSLFRLDILRWHWDQVVPISPSPVHNQKCVLPAEQQRHLSCAISGPFATSTMVKSTARLHFFTDTHLLSVHPITLVIERDTSIQGRKPKSALFSVICSEKTAFLFGGWDQQKQRADTIALDIETPMWYKPQVSSFSSLPRPRNLHSAAVVSLRNSPLVSDADELGADAYSSSKDAIVQMFGWNGRNCMDDVDVLVPRPSDSDMASDDLIWGLGKRSVCDLIFNFPDDSDKEPLLASRIILSARSSRLRAECNSASSRATTTGSTHESGTPSRNSKITIDIPAATKLLFQILVKFLYSDSLETSALPADPTPFIELVRCWAIEHERRIIEEIALTIVRRPPRLAQDLAWALQNPIFSDLTLIVDGISIPAHKAVLCSRSSYFRGLCLSGLRESREKTIPLVDVALQSFLIVLEFMYTTKINFESLGEVIVDVFLLSSRFSLRRLKADLESIMGSNLSIENACSLLILADQHHADSLRRTCLAFIRDNYTGIRQTHEYQELASQVQALISVM